MRNTPLKLTQKQYTGENTFFSVPVNIDSTVFITSILMT